MSRDLCRCAPGECTGAGLTGGRSCRRATRRAIRDAVVAIVDAPASVASALAERAREEVEMEPLHRNLVFRDGLSDEEGYRKVGAQVAGVDEADVRVQLDGGDRHVDGVGRVPVVRWWVRL